MRGHRNVDNRGSRSPLAMVHNTVRALGRMARTSRVCCNRRSTHALHGESIQGMRGAYEMNAANNAGTPMARKSKITDDNAAGDASPHLDGRQRD